MTTTTRYYQPKGTPMQDRRMIIERDNLPASCFATHGDDRRSDHYTPVSTMDIVDRLEQENWVPVRACENRITKRSRNVGFQRHEIRFAHRDSLESLKIGDVLQEMVLVNSFDGTSKLQANLGLYRPVCTNGMVVCEGVFESAAFKHMGLSPDRVVDYVVKMTAEAPKIAGMIDEWQQVILDYDDKRKLATEARNLRFGKDSEFNPELLLETRRNEDESNDLWTVFNVLQENVVRGGIKDYTLEKTRRTRPLANITENHRVNKGLFELAHNVALSR